MIDKTAETRIEIHACMAKANYKIKTLSTHSDTVGSICIQSLLILVLFVNIIPVYSLL